MEFSSCEGSWKRSKFGFLHCVYCPQFSSIYKLYDAWSIANGGGSQSTWEKPSLNPNGFYYQHILGNLSKKKNAPNYRDLKVKVMNNIQWMQISVRFNSS